MNVWLCDSVFVCVCDCDSVWLWFQQTSKYFSFVSLFCVLKIYFLGSLSIRWKSFLSGHFEKGCHHFRSWVSSKVWMIFSLSATPRTKKQNQTCVTIFFCESQYWTITVQMFLFQIQSIDWWSSALGPFKSRITSTTCHSSQRFLQLYNATKYYCWLDWSCRWLRESKNHFHYCHCCSQWNSHSLLHYNTNSFLEKVMLKIKVQNSIFSTILSAAIYCWVFDEIFWFVLFGPMKSFSLNGKIFS